MMVTVVVTVVVNQTIITNFALRASSDIYLTIILRNRAEYHLILSRRGRRPSWLNQGIFRKIEQDNCFIIQQIPIDYHFQNVKNYGSMMETLKASNIIKIQTELQEIEVYYRSLKKTYLQTHVWK